MPYTIKITKTERVIRKAGLEWEVVRQVNGQNEYDYTPEVEKWADVETKVLEQSVEELDLAAVIKAINRL